VVDDITRGFHDRFPSLGDVRPQRTWGGWIAMTPSWLPVAGEAAPNVFYAVVPWLVYPLVGAVFGVIVARSVDRRAIFRRAGLLGVGLCVAGAGLIAVERPSFDVQTYWREPLSFIVGILGIVLVWLTLCDIATRRAWIDRRLGVVYGWSGRVIPMYFSHWIIVGWGIGVVGFHALSLEAVLVAMAVAVITTSFASRFAGRLEAGPWRSRGSGATPGPVPAPVVVDSR